MLRDEFGACHLINAPAAVGDQAADAIHQPPLVHLPPRPIVRWSSRWFARKLKRKLLGREPAPSYPFTRYLKNADAVLALGGDNYSLDYGRPDRFFDTPELTRQAGKPFVIWGASVGTFSADPDFERFAAQRLQHVDLICARESETVRYLASLGVEKNVVAVSDPAFLLSASRPNLSSALEKTLAEPALGLNLSGLMGRYRADADRWIDEACSWLTQLLSKIEMPVVLVPHVIHSRDDDHQFLVTLQQRVAAPADRLMLLPRDYDCQQLKWVIGRLHAFVGARTHSTIAALSSCVPTFSIGYSLKSRGINHDIFGHTDYVLPIEELTAESFSVAAQRLLDERNVIKQHLEATMPSYRERARDGVRHLAELLRGGTVSGELQATQPLVAGGKV